MMKNDREENYLGKIRILKDLFFRHKKELEKFFV